MKCNDFDESDDALMIRAKKSLGQHFLRDENIARKIVEAFLAANNCETILEVGPGTGALTKFLLRENASNYFAVEADERMIAYLVAEFPEVKPHLFHEDFLQFDFGKLKTNSLCVIGNFPYNISSQILFRVFENKEMVPMVTGMFQKEVAQRIASKHGNKDYGILSVLLQAFYHVKYLFEVNANSFSPPPNVKSAVIQLIRKKNPPHLKSELFFRELVKAAFNQRRKMMRNSLSKFLTESSMPEENIWNKRAEQLSVEEWIELANDLFRKNN
ncbi:MAG: 16S rRNA (adenine(1518)-N(6)/adenine(1519)-N(6))-dimethyltransferase RsmA [Chitinophagales bacterium]